VEEESTEVKPPEKEIRWGTKETGYLTKRMAYRVAVKAGNQRRLSAAKRRRLPIRDIIHVGLGQYGMDKPDWYPVPKELELYDDDWDDWKDSEEKTLLRRLRAGAKRPALYEVFKVSPEMASRLNTEAFGHDIDKPMNSYDDLGFEDGSVVVRSRVEPSEDRRVIILESHESDEYDTGRFTPIDFELGDDLRYANRRWTEYEERVDLEKPTNQTTIEMMILLEVQNRTARRDLNSTKDKTRDSAQTRIRQIRDDYSKAAADVALLEKQFKKEPEQESLDAVIIRTQEIRKNWRPMEIENEMASRGLFDMVEAFHRTYLDDETGSPKTVRIPVPQKRTEQDMDMKTRLATIALEQSEGKESAIVVGSDG